jgi:intracellular sulfur oxidation DsrE/DsrF family protein
MMKRFLLIFLAALVTSVCWAQVKVVYHLSEGIPQAARSIANIRNHLTADPTVKIVVVTHGPDIDFLLDGAKNPKGQPFSGDIGELAGRGVEFRVCNNTLITRDISKDKVAMEAQIVPSGVAEVARLQAKEGFVYLHP